MGGDAGMSQDAILETYGLEKRFHSGGGLFRRETVIHAVNGVSLSVKRGETLAIVGESGCGKSTLARLLLRLAEPSAGEIFYEGQSLTALRPPGMRRIRSQMQIVFQDPFSTLNPRMTVEELVGEPLLVHTDLSRKARRERVSEVLNRVGLRPDMADRFPHEFSGGQRQRLSIARALIVGPKLLIGDEPVSALDVSVQAQIVNLLEDLKAELGLTLIMIAHDLAVIRHMADRVAVMYLGEVVELATTEELFGSPRHPYSRALLESVPLPVPGRRATRPAVKGDLTSPAKPPPGCKFHLRCPHAVDICKTVSPTLVAAAAGHSVACHLHDKLPAVPTGLDRANVLTPAAEQRFALWRNRGPVKATASGGVVS